MEEKQRKHDGGAFCVSLPEDIIFAVLVRLPVKALCRFRCVCKGWRALISDDPAFSAAQRSHAGDLIVAVFGSWPDLELRVLDMHGDVLRVFEVRERAVLAPTRLDLIFVDRMHLGAMIVDPASRRAFTVGRHDERTYAWGDFSFGRATPSGTYKVLHLYQTHTTVCEVATITVGGGADDEPTWRRRRPLPNLVTCFFPEHKATVNGVLYFMPRSTYGTSPSVAAFDLESEEWMKTINDPPLELEVEQEEWRIALTELNGTLCMVHNIQCTDAKGVVRHLCANVWRLIDYNQSVWVKVYTIRMPSECLHIQVLLDVLDDGRILLLNSSRSRHVLQFFNPTTEAVTDTMEMAEGFIGRMAFYTGSLLSS